MMNRKVISLLGLVVLSTVSVISTTSAMFSGQEEMSPRTKGYHAGVDVYLDQLNRNSKTTRRFLRDTNKALGAKAVSEPADLTEGDAAFAEFKHTIATAAHQLDRSEVRTFIQNANAAISALQQKDTTGKAASVQPIARVKMTSAPVISNAASSSGMRAIMAPTAAEPARHAPAITTTQTPSAAVQARVHVEEVLPEAAPSSSIDRPDGVSQTFYENVEAIVSAIEPYLPTLDFDAPDSDLCHLTQPSQRGRLNRTADVYFRWSDSTLVQILEAIYTRSPEGAAAVRTLAPRLSSMVQERERFYTYTQGVGKVITFFQEIITPQALVVYEPITARTDWNFSSVYTVFKEVPTQRQLLELLEGAQPAIMMPEAWAGRQGAVYTIPNLLDRNITYTLYALLPAENSVPQTFRCTQDLGTRLSGSRGNAWANTFDLSFTPLHNIYSGTGRDHGQSMEFMLSKRVAPILMSMGMSSSYSYSYSSSTVNGVTTVQESRPPAVVSSHQNFLCAPEPIPTPYHMKPATPFSSAASLR